MKQLLRYFIFTLTAGLVFTACQRELFFDTLPAIGTLTKDANGNCAPVTPNGSYVKAVALDATNYVDVQVNITRVGYYVVKTNTANGYYFYDSSIVAVLGVNTFRLRGYGTPIAAGIDDFTVLFGTSTCSLSNIVTAASGGGTGVAQFTLAGSPNACAGAAQTNNFFAGTPTVAALNKDTIYVNVTQIGSYTITASTTPSNGLTFSKSGTFTAVGPNQQVILEASGTPSTAGSIPYTINTTSPASNCGFNLTVQAAASATFTFNCALATLNGTFQAGTPMVVGTNYITIPVIVTGAGGTYNITTTSTSNNGITFAGAGVLTPTTASIKLYALPGTPSTQGTFTYNVTDPVGATCSIQVPYTPASTSTHSISATINGVFKVFDYMPSIQLGQILPFVTSLDIQGDSIPGSTERLLIQIGNGTLNIPVNIPYDVNQGAPAYVGGTYFDVSGGLYSATTTLSNPTPAFTVTLTSITGGALGATGTRVKGIFSGVLREFTITGPGPSIVNITGGSFDLTF